MEKLKLTVVNNQASSRYEALVDEEVVGYCDYRRQGGELILPHTFTDPAYRGRGVADALVEVAVTDAEEDGLKVVPQCWFVQEFLRRTA